MSAGCLWSVIKYSIVIVAVVVSMSSVGILSCIVLNGEPLSLNIMSMFYFHLRDR